MAAKKRRKRRAHRVSGAAPARRKARQTPAALADLVRSSPDRPQSAAQLSSGNGKETPEPARKRREGGRIAMTPGPVSLLAGLQLGLLGRVPTAFLPGRVFFAMGRPVPGMVCCVLQASLLGWVPAALWAVRAERHRAAKQRSLAARLRPL